MKYLISVVVMTGNNIFADPQAYSLFCRQLPINQPFIDVEAMTAQFKSDGRIIENGSNMIVTGNTVTSVRVFRDEDAMTEWKVLWEPYRSQFQSMIDDLGWTMQHYERVLNDSDLEST